MVEPTNLTKSAIAAFQETEVERIARVQREAEVVALAEANIDAGLGIDDDDLEAWLDDLDRDPDTPLPISRGGKLKPD